MLAHESKIWGLWYEMKPWRKSHHVYCENTRIILVFCYRVIISMDLTGQMTKISDIYTRAYSINIFILLRYIFLTGEWITQWMKKDKG